MEWATNGAAETSDNFVKIILQASDNRFGIIAYDRKRRQLE